MKEIIYRVLLIVIAVFIYPAHAENIQSKPPLINNYLSSPSGKYHVGFQDFHWINVDACPNKYLTEENKADFSQDNKNYCNEMSVRIYYPTEEVGSSPYASINDIKDTLEKYSSEVSKVSNVDVDQLLSFSKKDAGIAKGRFPVILFSSGYGMLPQSYENILLNLVSYGYIVIGINSEFINGPITIDETKVVNSILPTTDEQKKSLFIVSEEDLDYVYKEIASKKFSNPLIQSMDVNHIGLLGHSLGSAAVAHVAEKENVQAVAVFDLAWDNICPNTCKRKINKPFLEVFSSYVYFENKKGDFPYLCADQPLSANHEVIVLGNKLDPAQKNYSVHMSFTDQSTWRYFPAVQAISDQANANPDKRFSGVGNGWDILSVVNTNLLLFYNQHLKNNHKGEK